MNRNVANRCAGSEIGKDFHAADEDSTDRLCENCRKIMLEANAKQVWSWELLCGKTEEGRYEHFFPSFTQVEMCGHKEAFLVRLTPDETNGTHYGWWHSHHPDNGSFKGLLSMIYPREFLVEMCFPYGTAPEVKMGLGKILCVCVEEIRPAKRGEGIPRQDSQAP